MGIYKRFMLRDEHEATRLLLRRLKESPPEESFDELLIPTLNYAKRDRFRGQLTEDDHKTVLDVVHVSMRHLDYQRQDQAGTAANQLVESLHTKNNSHPIFDSRVKIPLYPAADESDSASLELLRKLLNCDQWDVEQTAVETLTSELAARIP